MASVLQLRREYSYSVIDAMILDDLSLSGVVVVAAVHLSASLALKERERERTKNHISCLPQGRFTTFPGFHLFRDNGFLALAIESRSFLNGRAALSRRT